MPRRPIVLEVEVNGKKIKIYDRALAREILKELLKSSAVTHVSASPVVSATRTTGNNNKIIVRRRAKRVNKAVESGGGELPSFVVGNPWVEEISSWEKKE